MYRIFCLTENAWVTRNDTDLICPNNVSHTINSNSLDEVGAASVVLAQSSTVPSAGSGISNYSGNLYWNDLNITGYSNIKAEGPFSTNSTVTGGVTFFTYNQNFEAGTYHIIYSLIYYSSSSSGNGTHRLTLNGTTVLESIIPFSNSSAAVRNPLTRSIIYNVTGGTNSISFLHGVTNASNTMFSRDASLYMRRI